MHTFFRSLHSACGSPSPQLRFMTDRRQQYLPSTQRIPSSSLYEPWVKMSGITPFVPLSRAAGWKTNSRLFAKQLIIKKRDACSQRHTKTAHGLSSVSWKIQTETDVSGFSTRWNLSPNNVCAPVLPANISPCDSEAKVTEHANLVLLW